MPVIKECSCPSCGGTIEKVTSSRGICPFCDNTYFFENLENFNQVLQKERINSGMNFQPCDNSINQHIIEFLTSDPAAPLDVLENAFIKSKKAICVPAYYYHCNGSSDYMCDVGTDNQKHVGDGKGGVKTVTETTWSTISGNIRADVQRTVSGNNKYDSVISELYKDNMSSVNNALVDIESLEIPPDAEVIPFDIAETALLDKYVRPDINEELKASVIRQIGNRKYRELSLGNSNINENNIRRQLISLYNVIFSDGINDYSMYVSGNGEKSTINGTPPTDSQRLQEYNDIRNAFNEADSKVSKSGNLGIVGIILAVILLIFGLWFISIPLVSAAVFFGFVKSKPDKEKRDELQSQMLSYEKQITDVRNDFIQNGRKIQTSDRTLIHN
ncbi:MAG: hypothetical protein NC040_08175 [Muribaculaceae bacterium]|nr:hypothetical protein [Alistipes senegalensis]MCM1474022.1 hypothetical protein [Muribaculaceae bacterium]